MKKLNRIKEEKLLEKMNTKHICECGSSYSHGTTKRHNRSKLHQQYLLRESIKQIQEMKYMMDDLIERMKKQLKIINSLVLYRDE